MNEPRYCSLAGCVCVACFQLEDGCSSCELLHPELLVYDMPLDLFNSLSEDEQIFIQDKYEYDLQHPDQADWFVD